MKQDKIEKLIVAILLVLYIFFGTNTPRLVAMSINYGFGIVILAAFCWYLYKYSGKYLAILGAVASIVLIYRSVYGYYPIPSQSTRDAQMASYNSFDYTLEEQIVKEMLPNSQFNVTPSSFGYGFKPQVESSHDASPI